jgi:hypothetical protein
MTANTVSTAALERLKQLGLMQPGSPIESDGFYTTTGECLPIRGGDWRFSSRAGAFALSLNNSRSDASAGIGFRPAFVI